MRRGHTRTCPKESGRRNNCAGTDTRRRRSPACLHVRTSRTNVIPNCRLGSPRAVQLVLKTPSVHYLHSPRTGNTRCPRSLTQVAPICQESFLSDGPTRPLQALPNDSGRGRQPGLHLAQMRNGLRYLLEIHFLSELVRIPLYYRTSMNEKKQTLPVRWGTASRHSLRNHQNSRG